MAALDKAIHIDDLPRDNDTTAPQDWLTNDDAPISQREAARIAGISESGLRARIRTGKVSKPDNYTEKWALDLKAQLEKEKAANTEADNTGLLFEDDTTKENAPTAESEGAEVTQPDNSPHSNTVSQALGSAWPTFSLFAHTSTTTAEKAITYPELVEMAAKPCEVEKGKAKAFTTGNATGKTGEAVKADDVGFAIAVIDIDNSTALDEIESGLQEIGIGRALIYSTKSATPIEKKWRVVVPFSEPLDRDTWHSITSLLCERFAGDKAMLSPTQVSFVPNEGSFYHHQELTTGEPLNRQSPVIARAIERKQERLKEFEREKEALAKAYASESKRAQQPPSLANGKSAIDAFNAQFSIASLLEPHGYKRHRGKKYLSPNSTSGVAGVVILDDPTTGKERVYSHHSPDSDPLANGFAHDAFSVFTVLEHGGDFKAALIAAGEITGVTKANQEAYHQQKQQQKQERLNDFAQVQDVSQAMGQQGQDGATEIAPVRLESLILDLNIPPESDDCGWALANWLPFGEVTLLAGHGGSGKSYVALVLAVHVALGLPFGGVETTQSRVLFVSCEDSGRIVKQRLSRIADGMMESLANVGQSLDILDLSDIDATLYVANSYDKTCQATVRTAELMQLVKSRNYGLIIVDNASETFGGNEINRQEVRGFVRMLRTGLADISSSVLLLAHINKISATNGGKEDYSGSTAWHNSVRSRISLGQGTIKDQLLLTHQKSNYGKLQEPIALMWNGPCPLPITSEQTKKVINENNNKKREWLLDAMRQIESNGDYLNGSLSGRGSLRSQLKKIDGCPFGEKGDGREIESILEELEASGKIEKVHKTDKAKGVWQLIPDQSGFDDLLS